MPVSTSFQILKEFQLVTGVDPDGALLQLLREFSEAIIELATTKKAARLACAMLQAEIDATSGYEKNCMSGQSLFLSIDQLFQCPLTIQCF